MSTPRSQVVDPFSVQILHLSNRCVRRAFLCGVDSVSGRDYSHRKDWIRQRLEYLVGIFAFDIATYAVMCNHFHLVVRSRPDIVASWSDEEVALRDMRLQGKRWFRPDGTPRSSVAGEVERVVSDRNEIRRLRRKLSDVSSLMSYFDRHLAVRANREDKVKGAFWEGTFHASVIKDDISLLACMAYVDLNPIRAMMAQTLEESDYTGAFDRISELRRELVSSPLQPEDSALQDAGRSGSPTLEWERQDQPGIGWLAPIELDECRPGLDRDEKGRRPSRKGFLPIPLLRYLEIVEWTGRGVRPGKRGSIPPDTPSVFESLGIEPEGFLKSILEFSKHDRYFRATERQGIPEAAFTLAS